MPEILGREGGREQKEAEQSHLSFEGKDVIFRL